MSVTPEEMTGMVHVWLWEPKTGTTKVVETAPKMINAGNHIHIEILSGGLLVN